MKDAFDKPIDSFSGEYRWLSNFYHAPITYNGVEYISTEVAYQASKACDDETRKKFIGLNSADAKKLGRDMQLVHLRPDWDLIKDKVMYEVCWLKFSTHPDLKEKLLATGDRELIEGNYWGDTYWGVYLGVGANKLGKTLMKIRSELRN